MACGIAGLTHANRLWPNRLKFNVTSATAWACPGQILVATSERDSARVIAALQNNRHVANFGANSQVPNGVTVVSVVLTHTYNSGGDMNQTSAAIATLAAPTTPVAD